MTGRVRVLLFATAPEGHAAAVVDAYHRISGELSGTPGLLGNELARSAQDPLGFVVISEWESLPAFQAWERGADHRRVTAPLRPYQDRERGTPFGIYVVEAEYRAERERPATGRHQPVN